MLCFMYTFDAGKLERYLINQHGILTTTALDPNTKPAVIIRSLAFRIDGILPFGIFIEKEDEYVVYKVADEIVKIICGSEDWIETLTDWFVPYMTFLDHEISESSVEN